MQKAPNTKTKKRFRLTQEKRKQTLWFIYSQTCWKSLCLLDMLHTNIKVSVYQLAPNKKVKCFLKIKGKYFQKKNRDIMIVVNCVTFSMFSDTDVNLWGGGGGVGQFLISISGPHWSDKIIIPPPSHNLSGCKRECSVRHCTATSQVDLFVNFIHMW